MKNKYAWSKETNKQRTEKCVPYILLHNYYLVYVFHLFFNSIHMTTELVFLPYKIILSFYFFQLDELIVIYIGKFKPTRRKFSLQIIFLIYL